MYYLFLTAIIYSILSLFSQSRAYQKIVLIYLTTIAILFFGLRWQSGADFDGYLSIFARLPLLSDFSGKTILFIHGEPGFLLFSSFLKTIGMEGYMYMFVLSLLSIALKAFFFSRESKNAPVALALYILFIGMTYEFIQVRYAIALGLVLISLFFLYRDKILLSLILMFIAVSFHYFCIIFFIFYILKKVNFLRWRFFLLCCLIFLIVSNSGVTSLVLDSMGYFSGDNSIYRRASGYLDGDSHYSKPVAFTSVLVVRTFLLSLIVLSFGKKLGQKELKLRFYSNLMMISLFVSTLFSFNSIMFSRALALTEILNFLLLSFMVPYFKNTNTRVFVYSIITFVGVVFFLKLLNSENVYDYQTWLGFIF